MSLQVEIEKKLNDKVLSVSFDTAGKQGITGILGASGCGKSMTLKCIAGIETPDRGKIVLNGRVLFDSGKKINLRVQDRHVGYLFQNYALFPNMTVEKNIAAGFQYRPGQKMTAEEIKKQTADYMELLHVTELKSSYPGKLSGGQQQRVALARILASDPEVLMLDEHFIKQGDLSQEMVQQGVVGRIAGFNVFESNNMDYESTTRVSSKKTTTEFIAGHPNWCHRVMEWQTAVHLQDLSGSGKYIGASAVQGRKVYGLKVSKPQTLYIKRTETAT